MKLYIKNIFVAIVTIPIALASCFDLNQYPQDSLPNEDAFRSMNDAKFWMNGCYENLRKSTHGTYMYRSELQTDLIDIALTKLGGNTYTWEEFTASETTTSNIWSRFYKDLANINNCIEGFEQIPTVGSAEATKLNAYKGELHLLRALYYTRLASLFCKAYDPTTAATDLGLPLQKGLWIKSSELPSRSTLEETYNFILSDISQAETLLVGNTNAVGSRVMTPDAALLLKARVLLYKRDWQGAYEAAAKLIDANTYPLATTETALRNIWAADNTAETLVQLYASATEILDNTSKNVPYTEEYAYMSGGTLVYTYSPAYLPNKWVLDLYDSTDLRKSVYYTKKRLRSGATSLQDSLYIVYKFPGNPALRPATTRSAKAEHAPKIFRIAEAYLIAAEAAYMSGDEASATTALNKLRTARKASAITATGEALLTEIKQERVRELAYEGYRFMDLKRWNEGVDRKQRPPQDVRFIRVTPPEQYNALKKEASDYKWVWPIPSEDILRMGEQKLKQNPGW